MERRGGGGGGERGKKGETGTSHLYLIQAVDDSHQKTQEYIKGKSPLFILLLVFSVTPFKID